MSACFKTNPFSWLNLGEIKFTFICPVNNVLLTFFNLKFFTSDRGSKACLFCRLESLFSELLSGLPLSVPLFWSSKCPLLQATAFQNSFKIKCLILSTIFPAKIFVPSSVKVLGYPFKQNRSMLKNMTVLLYTYFIISPEMY